MPLLFVQIKGKKGIITCLLNRVWVICSSSVRFHEEVAKLKDNFLQNGYSDCFFQKQVKRFLDNKYSTVSESTDESEKVVEKEKNISPHDPLCRKTFYDF